MSLALKVIIIFTLIGLLVPGLQVLETAKGNFILNIPGSPDNNSLSFRIISPAYGEIYNSNEVVLNFTITKPKTWFLYGSHVIGYVLWAGYSIDGKYVQEIVFNDTKMGGLNAPRVLNFSVVLSGLSEGQHTLRVGACGRSMYGGSPPNINSIDSYSGYVYFEIDSLAPKISILSIKNETYSESSLALNFLVDKATIEATYSLDNQQNTTIAGNTTLTELSNGPHSLTIYANDRVGNVGKSDTVNFTIDTITPSLSPSSSSTQQPTLEPTPTLTTYVRLHDGAVFYVFGSLIFVAAIIIALCVLVYFRKGRR